MLKKMMLGALSLYCCSAIAYYEYDSLKKEYTDSQFKKIFANEDVPSCIWVREYRGNQVLDGKVSEKQDECMRWQCKEAAFEVTQISSKSGIKTIELGFVDDNEADRFSEPLRKIYKQLFPSWKSNMQSQLNECASGKPKGNSSTKKSNNITDTVGSATKSLKSITGIFGKD